MLIHSLKTKVPVSLHSLISNVRNFIIFCLGIFTIFTGCHSGGKTPVQHSWDSILKEIEVTNSLQISDSLKAERIKNTFEKYAVTMDDYRQFYRESIENGNFNHLNLLKQIEKSISQDMTGAMQEERNRYEGRFRGRDRQDNSGPASSGNN